MSEGILVKKRDIILKKWVDAIFASYPPQSSGFLKNNHDPFNNPVGTTVVEETGILFDQLVGDMDAEVIAKSLDRIIRIRAVQEFTPSEAVNFIFKLKKILMEVCGESNSETCSEELLNTFSRIDDIGMTAFDIHSECRERISRIRVSEAKMSAFMRGERILRLDEARQGDKNLKENEE